MTAVVCDLDGVVYRGPEAVPGSAQALSRLAAEGVLVIYATNNSMRPPEEVVTRLQEVASVEADPTQVVTSSQAAAALLASHRPPTAYLGGPGIALALREREIPITEPAEAKAVVVGLTMSLTYEALARTADAIRSGARYVATNTDPTYPTAGGLLPGAGAIVAAVTTATGVEPEIAGKPHRAMADLLLERAGPDAWVIGDRLDTDVALARSIPGWRSILVLSGVTERTAPTGEADHVVSDLAAAVDLVLAS